MAAVWEGARAAVVNSPNVQISLSVAHRRSASASGTATAAGRSCLGCRPRSTRSWSGPRRRSSCWTSCTGAGIRVGWLLPVCLPALHCAAALALSLSASSPPRSLYVSVITTIRGWGDYLWTDVVDKVDSMGSQVGGRCAPASVMLQLPCTTPVRPPRLQLATLSFSPAPTSNVGQRVPDGV